MGRTVTLDLPEYGPTAHVTIRDPRYMGRVERRELRALDDARRAADDDDRDAQEDAAQDLVRWIVTDWSVPDVPEDDPPDPIAAAIIEAFFGLYRPTETRPRT